jgi:thiol:disulfide interchange protein
MRLRRFLAAVTLLLVVAAPLAAWSKSVAYSPEALSAAVAEKRVVVLDFHADWCPTCKRQAAALDELAADSALRDVVLLQVDFDNEVELKERHRVWVQSTLVVLRGDREVARATGVVSKDAIRALIAKAL